jgi:hypothetical protein
VESSLSALVHSNTGRKILPLMVLIIAIAWLHEPIVSLHDTQSIGDDHRHATLNVLKYLVV